MVKTSVVCFLSDVVLTIGSKRGVVVRGAQGVTCVVTGGPDPYRELRRVSEYSSILGMAPGKPNGCY